MVRTVTLQSLLMEIGASGGLGQPVTLILASRDEPVLVITHPHLEGAGIALKMAAIHLKIEPVSTLMVVMAQQTQVNTVFSLTGCIIRI